MLRHVRRDQVRDQRSLISPLFNHGEDGVAHRSLCRDISGDLHRTLVLKATGFCTDMRRQASKRRSKGVTCVRVQLNFS